VVPLVRREDGGRMTLEQVTDLMQSIAIILLAFALIGGRK
jgi:hypothetical protein